MPKKTFYIILAVIIGLVIVGLLIWYLTLNMEKVPTQINSVNFTTPGQNANKAKLQTISKEPVVSARLDNFGVLRYYDYSGQFWEFSANDPQPVVNNQAPIENVAEAIWSAGNKNIVKLGVGQTDSYFALIDPNQKSQFNFKKDVKSVAFSPDGKKIVYQSSPSLKNDSLLSIDSSGKNQKTLIRDFKLRDTTLYWPAANIVAITSRPSGTVPGNLWFLDIRNLNIRKIINNLFGLEALFSPDGKSFIYSYSDQNSRNLKLAAYDKNGNQKVINNVSTLVDKCVWSKDLINIYCATPKSWPDFAILPDDYYKNAFLTSDDIWKINTETGEKNQIAKDLGDISNLIVNSDENALFFTSKENQFLYKLDIK